MIACILFAWIGVQLSAPWWYFALLSVRIVASMVDIGIKIGKAAKE